MSFSICLVEAAVLSEKSFISSATTAKLLPCSPACAAIMAAFSDSRLVCSDISLMTFSMLPMDIDLSTSLFMTPATSSTVSLIFVIASPVFTTASLPVAASAAVVSDRLADVFRFFSTSFIEAFIWVMAVAVSLV